MDILLEYDSGFVYHLSADDYHHGNLLYSIDGVLLTRNLTSGESQVVVGDLTSGTLVSPYREGHGEYALFSIITSFVQMSHTQVLLVDTENNVFRMVDRTTRNTSLVAGDPTAYGNASRDGSFSFSLFQAPECVASGDGTTVYASTAVALCILDFSTEEGRVTHIYLDIKPSGLAFDISLNRLYFSTEFQIFYYIPEDNTINNVTGRPVFSNPYTDGSLQNATFTTLTQIAVLNKDTLLAVDFLADRLRIIDLNNNVTSSICIDGGVSSGGNISSCSFQLPTSVTSFNSTAIMVGSLGIISVLSYSGKFVTYFSLMINLHSLFHWHSVHQFKV